jgi:RNA polymerase sigma-70 factor (ECF subfamily)
MEEPMDGNDWLVERFEEHRAHLRGVAYRMLGSLSDADDAVQETWQRVSRADTTAVENLGGWLTTITSRVCLNALRSRRTRGEESLEASVPDPIVTRPEGEDPEQEAVLADSVGLALLVVLETLAPAERLAFVLHDLFAVPFDEIAPIVDRSPEATRQLASRARRRVQGTAPVADADPARQREVVDAFFAAARGGDFDALVRLLDPDVVVRADSGPHAATIIRGAEAVAGRAIMFAQPMATLVPAIVNGAAGVVITVEGQPFAVMAFTVSNGRIVAVDALNDPDRIRQLDLPVLDD